MLSVFVSTKGKSANDYDPQPIPATNMLRNAKKPDVKRLSTKLYGENWQDVNTLKFFGDVMNAIVSPENAREIDNREICKQPIYSFRRSINKRIFHFLNQ